MSNLPKTTDMIEAVETRNLHVVLKRLNDATPHDSQRKRRALYHAMTMLGSFGSEEMKKIREALNLP